MLLCWQYGRIAIKYSNFQPFCCANVLTIWKDCNQIQQFSCQKFDLKMFSAKWKPCSLGFNVSKYALGCICFDLILWTHWEQNFCYFADQIWKCIFLKCIWTNETIIISIKNLTEVFFPKGPIDSKSALGLGPISQTFLPSNLNSSFIKFIKFEFIIISVTS